MQELRNSKQAKGDDMNKRYIAEYSLLMVCTAIIVLTNNSFVAVFSLWGVGLYSYWVGQRDLKRDIESGALSGDYVCSEQHQRWLDEKHNKNQSAKR